MTRIAAVYAQALYELTREEGCSGTVLNELKALKDGFDAEPAFVRLLSAPNLTKEERCSIVDESFRGKVHPFVLSFMKLLTEKGYARHFPDCCTAYGQIYNRDNGIVEVTAVTAVTLTQEQTEKLTQKLSRITGKQIELINRVDTSCLGGVRLDYDGKRVDDTVANRLESVRTLLKNTVL